MLTSEINEEIRSVASQLGIEPAALLAIAEVESGGQAFASVNGRAEPLIRFEGHYFDRRLSTPDRIVARATGLASPDPGAVSNPRTQPGRWKLLERAAAIDRKAAYESVSWGIGQVMGAHWAWLGYASVHDLVTEVRASVGGQVRVMARYIDKAGLRDALQRRDWEGFARGYNGPAYRQYGYHSKIAAAYRRHLAMPVAPAPKASLRTVTAARRQEPAAAAAPVTPARVPAAGLWSRLSSAFGRTAKGR